MHIALYHGYELTGSGSNEYNRYLAKTLCEMGHHVHILCREPNPEGLPFVDKCLQWNEKGEADVRFQRGQVSQCTLHLLPQASVHPVYLTDKNRPGNVKSFVDLTDDELHDYHDFSEFILEKILSKFPFQVLFANHLVYQPVVAIQPCKKFNIPFCVFIHASALEYVVKRDERYYDLAFQGLHACQVILVGNEEVKERILNLYPKGHTLIEHKIHNVSMGVDTKLFQPVEKEIRFGSIKKVVNHSSDFEFIKKVQRVHWEDKNIILYVGALTVGKGVQTLLAAFPEVLRKNSDSQLVVIGDGSYRSILEDFVMAMSKKDSEKIRELIKKGFDLDRNDLTGSWQDVEHYIEKNGVEALHYEGLEEKVSFLGYLNHDYLRDLLPCADVAVFPSWIPESYGLVLFEALSSGVFPIVPYFSGFKDGLDQIANLLQKDDWIEAMKIPAAPESRVQGLVDSLLAVKGFSLQHSDRENLAGLAKANYDWHNTAQKIVEVLTHL